jgi:hypothetical protein
MLSYQSFFDVPPMIRECCNVFCIWKTNNTDELSTIAKRTDIKRKHLKRSQNILKINLIFFGDR